MFIFDLFEKKKQDAAAGRFVGGTSQDARVKNALDNAYRAVPAAKSPEEAALGYIDIQNSLNQKQDQVLSQQNKTNQQQTQQINALVADMRRKEKDFRDLNAQVSSMPNVTPQQVAKMAQDIEAAHDAGKDQAVDVPGVIAKQTTAQPTSQPAKTVAAPGPGASIAQIANFQQSQDQGATTAKAPAAAPQAKPAPAVTPPGRVIKGKNQSDALGQMAQQITQQPAQTAGNVVDFTQAQASKADKEAKALQAFGGEPEQKTGTYSEQATTVPSGAGDAQIASTNEKRIVKAYIGDTDANLTFLSGPPLKLKVNQVHGLVDAFALIPNGMNKDALKINLFSNRTFLIEWMFENIVNPATATNRPTDVDQDELNQGQLTLEGDVVPMTDNQTTNQAYADALTFLKFVYANPKDPMITTMRQDFAHKYQQRFQISQHPDPDRSYYLLDKQLSKKYNLPTPDFRGLEEEPYDGKSDWSDGKGQWSSENNLISSGNNPMGFSEGTNDIKKQMSKLEALALSANRAGDDAKCKRYQEKIQSLKQKLSQSMTEGLRSGEYHIHTVYFKDGTKKRIRVTSDEFDVADYYTKRGQAVDRVDYDYQIHSDMTEGDSGAKYKIKSIGKDKNGDYYISPSTGKKVYKSGVKRGDHENPKTGEHTSVAEGSLEEITRRGFLKGMGAAVGAAALGAPKDVVAKTWSGKLLVPNILEKNVQYYITNLSKQGNVLIVGTTRIGPSGKSTTVRAIDCKNSLWKYLEDDGYPVTNMKWSSIVPGSSADRIMTSACAIQDQALKEQGVAEAEGDFRAVIRKVMSKVHVDGGGGNLSYMISQKAPTMDMLRDVYHDDIERMLAKAHPNELKKAAAELSAMFAKQVNEAEGRIDPILIKALNRMPDGLASHKEVLDAAYDAYAMELGQMKMKSDYGVTNAYIPQLLDLYKKKHGLTFAEAETDYSKRRRRYDDVEAGRPVKPLPKNPQTDYAKKRAKERRDLEQFGEGTINYWTKLQNERNTKIASLVDELKESIEK